MEGLSIVIIVRYDTKLFDLWYKAYEKYTELDNQLIIIVDQPSWQMVKFLQEKSLKYYLVEYSNMYQNWNYGAQFATNEFVCFTQPDHHLSPGWDRNLRKLANENDYLGIKEYSTQDCASDKNSTETFCDKEGEISTFNFSRWEVWCKKNLREGVEEHEGNEICIHIKTFREIHGFGYSPYSNPGGHIHHEAGTKWRIEKRGGRARSVLDAASMHFKWGYAQDFKEQRDAGIKFHFGGSYNADWGRKYHLCPATKNFWDVMPGNLWIGSVKCMKCGLEKDPITDFGPVPECYKSTELRKLVHRGFWLCENCRKSWPDYEMVVREIL